MVHGDQYGTGRQQEDAGLPGANSKVEWEDGKRRGYNGIRRLLRQVPREAGGQSGYGRYDVKGPANGQRGLSEMRHHSDSFPFTEGKQIISGQNARATLPEAPTPAEGSFVVVSVLPALVGVVILPVLFRINFTET